MCLAFDALWARVSIALYIMESSLVYCYNNIQLTRVEIDGKLFQFISFDYRVDEFAAQWTFGLNGHR